MAGAENEPLTVASIGIWTCMGEPCPKGVLKASSAGLWEEQNLLAAYLCMV